MEVSTRLASLRALLSPVLKRELVSCSFLDFPIPRGAITEICGSGKSELVLRFLAEHKTLSVAWVEERFSAFPTAFTQFGIDMKRVLFLEGNSDSLWIILQLLKSQAFGVVVLYGDLSDFKVLRKIQIAAEKSNTIFFWLSKEPSHHWTSSLQIQVSRNSDSLSVEVLKQRGGTS